MKCRLLEENWLNFWGLNAYISLLSIVMEAASMFCRKLEYKQAKGK